MGKTAHTDSGLLNGVSQVSGFERATKHLNELAWCFSVRHRLAQTSHTRSRTFPFYNRQEVYSQTYPAKPPCRGIEC